MQVYKKCSQNFRSYNQAPTACAQKRSRCFTSAALSNLKTSIHIAAIATQQDFVRRCSRGLEGGWHYGCRWNSVFIHFHLSSRGTLPTGRKESLWTTCDFAMAALAMMTHHRNQPQAEPHRSDRTGAGRTLSALHTPKKGQANPKQTRPQHPWDSLITLSRREIDANQTRYSRYMKRRSQQQLLPAVPAGPRDCQRERCVASCLAVAGSSQRQVPSAALWLRNWLKTIFFPMYFNLHL